MKNGEEKDLQYDQMNEWKDDLDECDLDVQHDVIRSTPQDAVPRFSQNKIDTSNGTEATSTYDIQDDTLKPLEANDEHNIDGEGSSEWNDDLDDCDLNFDDEAMRTDSGHNIQNSIQDDNTSTLDREKVLTELKNTQEQHAEAESISKCNADSEVKDVESTPIDNAECAKVDDASKVFMNFEQNPETENNNEVNVEENERDVTDGDDENLSKALQEDQIRIVDSHDASKPLKNGEEKDLQYDQMNERQDDLDECDLDVQDDVVALAPRKESHYLEFSDLKIFGKNDEHDKDSKKNVDWNIDAEVDDKILGTTPNCESNFFDEKPLNNEEGFTSLKENNKQIFNDDNNNQLKDDLDVCNLRIEGNIKSCVRSIDGESDADVYSEEEIPNGRYNIQIMSEAELKLTRQGNLKHSINHYDTTKVKTEPIPSNFQLAQTVPPIIAEVPSYYLEKLLPTEPVAIVTDKGKHVKIDFTKLLQNEIAKRLLMEKELASHLERISNLEQDLREKNKIADSAGKMEAIINEQREKMEKEFEGWESEKSAMRLEAQALKQTLTKVEIDSKETINGKIQRLNDLKLKLKLNDVEHQKLETEHKLKISNLTTQLQNYELSKLSTSKLNNEITGITEKLEAKTKICEKLTSQVNSLQNSLTETKLALFDKSKEYKTKTESYESLLERKEKDYIKKIENQNKKISELSSQLQLLEQDNVLSPDTDVLTQQLTEKNQICNEMKSKIIDLEQIRCKLEAESFNVTKKHARKTRELEEALNKYKIEKNTLEEQLQESTILFDKLSSENTELHNKVLDAKTNLNEKSAFTQELERQMNELQAGMKKEQNQSDARLSQLNQLHEAEVRNLNESKNDLEKELINQKLSNSDIQRKFESLSSEHSKLKEVYVSVQSEAERLELTVYDNETKVQDWVQKYETIVEEKDHLETDFEEMLVQMGLQKEIAEEDMIESENKISSLEDHIEELVKENHQAHESFKTEIHSLQLTNNNLTEKLKDASNNFDKIVTKFDNERDKCDEMSVEIEKLRQVNIELNGQIDKLRMNINLIEEKTSNDTKISVAEWEERCNAVNEELAYQKKELDELRSFRRKTSKEQDSTKVKALESTVQTQTNSLSQKENVIDHLKIKASNLDSQLSTALEQKTHSERKLSETKKLCDQLKIELSNKISQIEKMEVDLLSSELELNAMHEKCLFVENYEKEIEETKKVIGMKDNDIFNLQLQIESLKGDLISTQSELAEKMMSEGIQDSQAEISELHKSEIALLKDKLPKVKSNVSKKESGMKDSLECTSSLQNDIENLQEIIANKDLEVITLQKKIEDMELSLRHTNEDVSILEPGSKEEAESVDFMREQIIFLATALEKAETRRAEAMDQIIAERKANADTIKRLKESVKRFYSTLSCTESAP